MPRIITVANNKGGVGKTTTAQALGTALAQIGRTVLLMDLESQHSLTDLYYRSGEIEHSMTDVLGTGGRAGTLSINDIVVPTYQPNLYLAPAAADLVLSEEGLGMRDNRATPLYWVLQDAGLRQDYIVIDTSPSLGFLLLNALVAADEVIIPIQPDPMAARGFTGIYSFIKRARTAQERSGGGGLRLYLRALQPTFYHAGYIVDEGVLNTLRAMRHPDYQDQLMPMAPGVVPETTLFKQATVYDPELRRTQTIFDIAPEHPGAIAYQQLAEAVDG